MEIQIHEYQPTWPTAFEAIKAELTSDLAQAQVPHLTIEHIGSTAVPFLAGKNIIDILILIPPPAFTATTLSLFKRALMLGERQGGYHYIGDGGVQGRWSFKLCPGSPGLQRVERHVYVAAEGSLPHRNYVAVRDTLRGDGALREEYAAVKVEAAGAGAYDNVMQYATRKNGVVRKILRRAGWSEEEVDAKEAQAVKDWPRGVEI